MAKYIILLNLNMCLLFSSCITEYVVTDMDEVWGILVVEGMITDNESTITLSRSVGIHAYHYYISTIYANYANVYVECDDGTQWEAELQSSDYWMNPTHGQYIIKTGKLNVDRKYRLKIEIEEEDRDSNTGYLKVESGFTEITKMYEYCSEYSYPVQTPEIDNIFWTKKGIGQPVQIYVSTHDPKNEILHYRWSFKEDWEINSPFYVVKQPELYYCWKTDSSTDLLVGSAVRMVDGKLTERITEISPYDPKLSIMYRINVNQNAISKRAYNYFENIKKNIELSGSIFAPIPSEMRGNIVCTTDPNIPVIGYIEVSTTASKQQDIIRGIDNAFEYLKWQDCSEIGFEELMLTYGRIPDNYIELYQNVYAPIQCVDCKYQHGQNGTKQKPDDWPNDHE